MRSDPLVEVVLRKYEPPSDDLRSNLHFFLLSLGLVRPGEKSSLAENVFFELLTNPNGVSVSYLARKFGCSESAVRYHLQKLRELHLVEGRRIYRIAEGDLEIAFKVFRRFVVGEILDRIEDYVKRITDSLSREP